MKRLFIVITTILLGCSVASAQQKEEMVIGGTIGTAIEASDGELYSVGFAFQPEFGYFFADNCKVGGSVGYALSNGISVLTLAPSFSYYARLCEGMYYTPSIDAGLIMAVGDGSIYPGLGLSLNLLSIEFRPTKHFGFNVNLASINFNVLSISSIVGFKFGMNPTVGIRYYF